MRNITVLFCLMVMMLANGCVTAVYFSKVPDAPHTCDYWAGNITVMNIEEYPKAMKQEDYVLPVWLDRTLNVTALTIAFPFSIISDIITFPYQLYVYKGNSNAAKINE